jgi:hypothetical protein
VGKTKIKKIDKLLKAEVEKYRRWAANKGFFRDRYSLISYFNRKNKIISVDGIYYINLGKRKYKLDELEKIFND